MAFSTELVRPDDLLYLHISGTNLILDPVRSDDPVLIVEDRAKPAYLIIEFPPQAVAEQAYFEWDKNPIAPENKDASGNVVPRQELADPPNPRTRTTSR